MINGIINIHKEKGFTSHDVVAKLRGIAGQRKIGHTGTLDPDATGVLPVCLGKATKLCDMLTDKDKVYETVLLLGQVTDTQDISGKILSSSHTNDIEESDVRTVIDLYVGVYEQIPPMYSALKVNGKKLYELAREGKVIERKARPVTIHNIEILEMNLPEVRMRVHCSKGTYIRTLCHDIGEKLGVGGCMKELIRTQVSTFLLEDSFLLSEVQALKDLGKLEECVTEIDTMFLAYKKMKLSKMMELLAINGSPIEVLDEHVKRNWKDEERIRVYSYEDVFIGIYKFNQIHSMLKLEKMFYDS